MSWLSTFFAGLGAMRLESAQHVIWSTGGWSAISPTICGSTTGVAGVLCLVTALRGADVYATCAGISLNRLCGLCRFLLAVLYESPT